MDEERSPQSRRRQWDRSSHCCSSSRDGAVCSAILSTVARTRLTIPRTSSSAKTKSTAAIAILSISTSPDSGHGTRCARICRTTIGNCTTKSAAVQYHADWRESAAGGMEREHNGMIGIRRASQKKQWRRRRQRQFEQLNFSSCSYFNGVSRNSKKTKKKIPLPPFLCSQKKIYFYCKNDEIKLCILFFFAEIWFFMKFFLLKFTRIANKKAFRFVK